MVYMDVNNEHDVHWGMHNKLQITSIYNII